MDSLDENKLDLSGQCLKKIPKIPKTDGSSKITELHLDNNDLHKLENIAQFPSVVELSATHNSISRMYPVGNLRHLVRLNLSHNELITIEGLKELVHLTYLNLSSNRIKAIDQLRTNLLLETLDLSENLLTVISNISQLAKLKKLLLHKNQISQLRHCEVYLPLSLETLTLAGNKLTDLNEISHLVSLVNLLEISIVSNPCVQMTGDTEGFDYRPFLVNWCTGLKVIDGFAVDDIECLKGEWLYCQGRGRQFRPGQHNLLKQYLVETCPLNNQSLQSEHERKLRLILSKAHHHQSQLRMSDQMPNLTGSVVFRNPLSELMTRSLDPSLLDSCKNSIGERKIPINQEETLSRSLHCDVVTNTTARDNNNRSIELKTNVPTNMVPIGSCGTSIPLDAATKLVPVPESLISPMVTSTPPLMLAQNIIPINDIEVSPSKLETIRSKAIQKSQAVRQQLPGSNKEQAAICIQKMWRGYYTRNLNPKVLSIYQHLQTRRTYQYIQKLSEDMEATRAVLDSEHKLQLLQMQAINALWKKVVSLQPSKWDESIGEVKDLAQTCDRLNSQVQRLQSCMQEVLRCVSPTCQTLVSSTQTDITAVHTPKTDIPIDDNNTTQSIQSSMLRPSSLAIISESAQQAPQLSHYADSLVVDVIKDTVPTVPSLTLPEEP